MKMEKTECSETSAYKIQTPGNYPEENLQHTEHGESLKSSFLIIFDLVIQHITQIHTVQSTSAMARDLSATLLLKCDGTR